MLLLLLLIVMQLLDLLLLLDVGNCGDDILEFPRHPIEFLLKTTRRATFSVVLLRGSVASSVSSEIFGESGKVALVEAWNLIRFRLSKWSLRTSSIWSALLFLARVPTVVVIAVVVVTVVIIAETKRRALSVVMARTARLVVMTALAITSGAIQRVHFIHSLRTRLEFSL